MLALGFSSSLALNITELTHDSSLEASLQCESLCVASDHQPGWIICYTCVAFLQCGWACVSSNFQLQLMIYRTLNSCLFSPLWVRVCVLRFLAWPNDLLQVVQLNFFSLLWVNRCFFRLKAWLNDLPHWSQVCFGYYITRPITSIIMAPILSS